MFTTLASNLVGKFLSVLEPVLLILGATATRINDPQCRSVRHGYQCQPEMTHQWGMYSPWFSAPSRTTPDVPEQCEVTFALILSRHGSRFPTSDQADNLKATIQKVQRTVEHYGDEYAFIRDYRFSLGADDLTQFGEQELFDSGVDFFERYRALSSNSTPFVRASGNGRVIQSSLNWTQGFHLTKTSNGTPDDQFPYSIEIVGEGPGSNNTLNHGLCDSFEHGVYSRTGADAMAIWRDSFVPAILDRVNTNLPGADLNVTEVVNMMSLCPFETIAQPDGQISPFCNLFAVEEWQKYNYYLSLNKYYGYGGGNHLGSTQGVGYVNELIARLTSQPLKDHTSTNHTLDDNNSTFPLGLPLYADFSHDNAMIPIFFALGLYNSTEPLSNTTLQTIEQTNGFSSAYTVPFAGRMFVEKLKCKDFPKEEMVRVLVNHRVMPLETCGGDYLGRCFLSDFVNSLTFAKQGGLWNECFT